MKQKITQSQAKKKSAKTKKLKRNSMVALKWNGRGRCEIFHRTELRKFLPNGAFPEVLGGWEL